MRQELEVLRNENLQKSYESEEMVKMRQELEALRNFKNLQMKNNAQHFTESKSDPVISSQNSYETQQRSTNSCNNIRLPETSNVPQTAAIATVWQRPQQQYGRPQQQYHNIENSKIDNGRRNRVPFYNGRDPWSAYFMQFELIAEINRWDTDTKAIELVTALKDEAMVYASYLSPETKRSFFGLCAAMSNRFGDHGYPETYRQELHTLRKQGKENIHEICFQSRNASQTVISNY
ncbi:Hypothetical predicted protein [Mytilus galloprovincialis]|uniref:Uncharacterized protein n=1 Tax=Mytilus galloprovincialis TaxID=29158 RepID=A0A8B6FZJ6_MYTGA|nr:Hypothetical predicted protein [Mytilus galloprovincialis]